MVVVAQVTPESCCPSRRQHPVLQQIAAGVPIHLTLERLETVDPAFDRTGVPGIGDSGIDGVDIASESLARRSNSEPMTPAIYRSRAASSPLRMRATPCAPTLRRLEVWWRARAGDGENAGQLRRACLVPLLRAQRKRAPRAVGVEVAAPCCGRASANASADNLQAEDSVEGSAAIIKRNPPKARLGANARPIATTPMRRKRLVSSAISVRCGRKRSKGNR